MECTLQPRQNLTLLLPKDAPIAQPFEATAISPETFSPSPEPHNIHSGPANSPNGSKADKFWSNSPHRRHASSFRGSSLVNTRQVSLQNSNLIFSPRPYEIMYTERAYFTALMQQQTSRTVDLIRQYFRTETQDQCLKTSKERRKLNKRLSLLSSKINETIEQEKAICVRLYELSVEIWSRDTWAQANLQRPNSISLPIPQTPSTYSTTSPMSCDMQTPITPLNPSSPEFIPNGYFECFHEPFPHQEAVGIDDALETVVEEGEGTSRNVEQGSRSHENDAVPKIDNAEDEWSGARLEATRTRRLSLPSLPTVWI